MQLEKVSGQKKVLYNVLIPAGKDSTTEIDALMIHETGIYVFENKIIAADVASHTEGWQRPIDGGGNMG